MNDMFHFRYLSMGLESFYLFRLDEEFVVRFIV
jgi:hypothetical protein